jgi:ribulose-phosphate 3-epimerase
MKTIISPSILGGSFSNMEKTISELDQSKAEYIHFDVMDGDFVPNLTFGPQFISNLRTKTKKIKVGIALKPKTTCEEIKKYLHFVDQVIIMTVEPGFGGQTFLSDQVNKIESISEYIKENNLNVDIEIDGGVNFETGKLCVDAGANILVAGSFLFKQSSLIKATNELNDFFNQ